MKKIFQLLFEAFIKKEGRKPNNLEMILLKREAMKKSMDERKILDMRGDVLDPNKPILGGTQSGTKLDKELAAGIMRATKQKPTLVKTEAQIKKELEGMNKKTIDRIRRRRYEAAQKAEREKMAKDPNYIPDIIDPEDFAGGGIAGMLGEPTYADDNHRVPFKKGHSAGRRKFLKLAAGLATIPIVGKYFKWAKPLAKTAKVADVTSVPIDKIQGMPAWFKPLVNKVIKEGDDVTKKFATQERQIVHKTELPDSKTEVVVTQQLDSGDVWVEIGRDKHGFPDGHLGQPVRLEYKAAEDIIPDLKTGKGGGKTKEEFWVEEAEFTGGHPENVKFEESTFNKFGEHGSNFDEVEMFATGKVKKVKPTKKAERTEWESGKAEADAEAAADMADDFASGGLAHMVGE